MGLVEIIHTPAKAPALVETPCIGVCTIEPKSGHCYGCKRTLREVAGWGRYSTEERQRIMAELARRRTGETA